MNKVYIDFAEIGDYEDFYNQLKKKLLLPENFGDNLDEFYDAIFNHRSLPLSIEFANMSVDQLETFEDLLGILESAEEEVESFTFSYYLRQFKDKADY